MEPMLPDEVRDYVTKWHEGHYAAKGWRLGQTFFNLLTVAQPGVAEKLRGSIRDPFHRDFVNEECMRFCWDHWEL